MIFVVKKLPTKINGLKMTMSKTIIMIRLVLFFKIKNLRE